LRIALTFFSGEERAGSVKGKKPRNTLSQAQRAGSAKDQKARNTLTEPNNRNRRRA
jgi:hypothetical protein